MIRPIEELLPHRAPAIVLDLLREVAEEGCVAEYQVPADCRYLDEEGQLPGWVSLEIMAQAASAFSGHRNLLSGRPVRVGYLLGARSVPVTRPSFPVGAVLEVEVRVLFLDEEGPSAFRCELRHQGECVAHATLKAIEIP
jgi:predicted hotdog family 3-hydroxylacyl-ACP dehydratase